MHTPIVALLDALAAWLAIVAGGQLLAVGIVPRRLRAGLRFSEWLTLAVALGALVWATLFVLLGLLGLLYVPLILALKVLGAVGGLATLVAVVRASPSFRGPGQANGAAFRIILGLMAAAAIVLVLNLIARNYVHGDALQYHYGLPRHYLRHHALVAFPSVLHSGHWLGSEMLYLFTLYPEQPTWVLPTKLLEFLFAAGLFVATYALARRLTAGPVFALAASAAVFSLYPLRQMGEGHTDPAVAFVAAAVVLVALLYRADGRAWLLAGGLLAGYAVVVKLTALFVLAPLFAVMLAGRVLPLRHALVLLPVALVPLLPWFVVSHALTGNALTPLVNNPQSSVTMRAGTLPEYVREGWHQRSANGLELTPSAYVRQVVPLLLHGSGERQPAGYLFLLAVAGGFAMLFGDRFRHLRWVYLSALAGLFLFTVTVFETYFMPRYYLLLPPLFFAFAAPGVQQALARRPRLAWIAPLIAVVAIAQGGIPRRVRDLREISPAGALTGRAFQRSIESDALLALYDRANELAGEGGSLMINDQFIYYLDVPFINVSALQNLELRFDRLDYEGFVARMDAEGVRAAIIREGTSGFTPQLRRFVREETTPVMRAGPVSLRARTSHAD